MVIKFYKSDIIVDTNIYWVSLLPHRNSHCKKTLSKHFPRYATIETMKFRAGHILTMYKTPSTAILYLGVTSKTLNIIAKRIVHGDKISEVLFVGKSVDLIE